MIQSTEKAEETKSDYMARNLTGHWTEARVSEPLRVESSLAALIARSVNSSVRR